jgi:hypothetical protein
VQEVPVYAVTFPVASARCSAEVTLVTLRLVVVAVPETVRPPAAVPLPMVLLAYIPSPVVVALLMGWWRLAGLERHRGRFRPLSLSQFW